MTFEEMLAGESEATTRLAETVSLAVLIEPGLLRRARLELERGLDAGAEADVWFSEFVASRDADGIVFHREAAEGLRWRLAASPERRRSAWALLQESHAGISPALQLEEEIAWLFADGGDQAMPAIKERLRSAVATLVGGERVGLAHWAVQAVHRLPVEVLELDETRMLYTAARLRLGDSPEEVAAPDWMSWVLPTTHTARWAIRLRMFPGVLELERVPVTTGPPAAGVIQVPAVEPLGLDVEDDEHATTVVVPASGPAFARIGNGVVRVKGSDGAVYELAPSRHSRLQRQREVVTFASLFAEYESSAPLKEPFEALQAAAYARGSGLVLTGPRGSGKTSLLVAFVRSLTRPCASHFFSDRTHRWRDPNLAWTSLAAQVEIHATSPVAAAARPVERLRLALHALPAQKDPFVLVIDGLDEMERAERRQGDLDVLFTGGLPPNVCVVCACEEEREERSAIEHRLRALFHGSSSLASIDLGHQQWERSRVKGAAQVDPKLAELLDGNPLAVRLAVETSSRDPSALESLLKVLPPPSLRADRPLGDPVSIVASRSWERLSRAAQELLGVIAAAREPLARFRIDEAAEASGPGADKVFDTIRAWLAIGKTPDFQDTYTVRHQALKAFIKAERREAARGADDDRVGKTVALWTVKDLGEFQKEYCLRYALVHALAAGDRERLATLLRDLDFLEARCRLDSPERLMVEAIDIFEATQQGVVEARVIADALGSAQRWLQHDPGGVRFVVDAAWRHEREVRPLRGGRPALRLRHPVESRNHGFREHRGPVLGCRRLEDGRLVSWSADGTLKLWAASDSSVETTLSGHRAEVTSCDAFDPGDDLVSRLTLVSGSRDGTVRTWMDGMPTAVTTHDAPVRGVHWTRAGIVSWDAAGTIRVSEPGAPPIQSVQAHHGAVTACLEHWPHLWSGSEDHTVRVWADMVNAGRLHVPLHEEDGGSLEEAHSVQLVNRVLRDELRAGKREIVFRDREYNEESTVLCIKIVANFDIAERRQPQRGWLHVHVGPRLYVLRVETVPEEGGESVRLTIAAPQATSTVLEGHTGAITSISSSFLDAVVCSCSEDGTIRLWDAARFELLNTLRGHDSAVLGCVVGRDNTLVSWSRDRTLRIWDQADARETARLVGHRGAVLGATFLEGGQILSWSADGTLRLWAPETGALLAVLEGHEAAVNHAVVLEDGSIVSCSDDRTLLRWDLQ